MNIRQLLSIVLLFSSVRAQDSFEKKLVRKLDTFTRGLLPAAVVTDLEKLASEDTPYLFVPPTGYIPPLFKAYPALMQKVPHLSLGIYPTPISYCNELGSRIGVSLAIKHDGRAGPIVAGKQLFSGNKLRKLEFLLADAKAHGIDCVITRGGTGSNHALATTIYAKLLGMDSICFLMHQPNARSVQRNLLLQKYYGAKIRINSSRALHAIAVADEFIAHKEKTGRFPYLIPTGGSCDRGALGFVNAAYELKEQIDQGIISEPAIICAAVGVNSGGTTAGLLLGLLAAGVQSHLIAVGVEPEDAPGQLEEQTKKLFYETNLLLTQSDPEFPQFDFPDSQFTVIRGFGGTDYGLYSKEGVAAKELLKTTENISLDGTYTAKAFAGMLDYIKKGDLQGKTVLFWNTYCSDDFSSLTQTVDYKKLPAAVHTYFEEEVQPLDQ